MDKLSQPQLLGIAEYEPSTVSNEVVLLVHPYRFTLSLFEIPAEGISEAFSDYRDAEIFATTAVSVLSLEELSDISATAPDIAIVTEDNKFQDDYLLVQGTTPNADHRLTITVNALKEKGFTESQIEAVTALISLGRYGIGQLSKEQEGLVCGAYHLAITKLAYDTALDAIPLIQEFFENKSTTLLSAAGRSELAANLLRLRFCFVDPLKFRADEAEELTSIWATSDLAIHTLYPRDDDRRPGSAAALYNAEQLTVSISLQARMLKNFKRHLFHELEHADSVHEYQRVSDDKVRSRRIGFQVMAASQSRGIYIVMHAAVNEGFNDRRSRLRQNLDPISNEGSYPVNRQIVDHLIKLTGEAVWDDYYDALTPEARKNAYRKISKVLAAIGGRGFLNRLDTTYAVFGEEYVLNLLEEGLYEELEYFKPLTIKANIREVDSLIDEVIELSDLESDSVIVVQ